MEKFSYIYDISKAENLRLYILEHTLIVEELTSKTLGYILNIDWEKSKSFGYGSSSLSFNQKIQIIQDMKTLDKEDVQKLSDLMYIRNKFAHINSIKLFSDLFNLGENGNKIKKNFDKWYSKKYDLTDLEDEFRFKVIFYYLFLDATSIMLKVIAEDAIERGRNAAKLDFLHILKDELIKLPNGQKILTEASNKIKQKLKIEC